jgi:mRNA-degrading endonuclease RelE of RelBE toxin-antitoxin system
MFTIGYAQSVAEDLGALRVFERRRVLDRIERELTYQPSHETQNKKPLRGLASLWEHAAPIWELRVGEYRVFYDVDEAASQVTVRAIRHKPPHKRTEEIL